MGRSFARGGAGSGRMVGDSVVGACRRQPSSAGLRKRCSGWARRVAWPLLACAALVPGLAAASDVVRLAGTVASLQGNDLVVTTRSGATEHATVNDATRISGRAPSTLAAITPQAFVGATAAPGKDGVLVASEVHIFPESMRGTGEGHRPMDGPAGTTMTNATVKAAGPATGAAMVANSAAGGRTLQLAYAGGEKTIVVPDGTPVVTIEPATRAELAPGTHVIVYALRDMAGHPVAQRISVGLRGSTPPI